MWRRTCCMCTMWWSHECCRLPLLILFFSCAQSGADERRPTTIQTKMLSTNKSLGCFLSKCLHVYMSYACLDAPLTMVRNRKKSKKEKEESNKKSTNMSNSHVIYFNFFFPCDSIDAVFYLYISLNLCTSMHTQQLALKLYVYSVYVQRSKRRDRENENCHECLLCDCIVCYCHSDHCSFRSFILFITLHLPILWFWIVMNVRVTPCIMLTFDAIVWFFFEMAFLPLYCTIRIIAQQNLNQIDWSYQK